MLRGSYLAVRSGLTFAAVLFAFRVEATVIVPVADERLLEQARLVVLARHEISWPALGDRPETDHHFRIERVLKGFSFDSDLTVRSLGGFDAEGRELRILGSPSFRPGDRVLLFLDRDPQGNWRILHFLQGVFYEREHGGVSLAVRPLEGVLVLPRPGEEPEPRGRMRSFDGFARWLERKSQGAFPGPSYWLENLALDPPAEDSVPADDGNGSDPLLPHLEKFSFFNSGGLKLRWFAFDSGGSVTWLAHESGQPGFAGGGFTEFQRALQAWNDEPQTPIQLVFGGTTSATAGFQRFDGLNVVLFNDPNQDIQGTFDCGSGGTLAIGGPWSSSANTGTFNNETFVRISGADIVFNDGIECRFPRSRDASKFLEEVMGHELGHSLGLGHSSELEVEPNFHLRDALMYFRAHDDARGASLRDDDLGGIRYLYRPSSDGGGGSGGGGGGTPDCPAGHLCLVNGRFRVRVTWQNQFNNTSGNGGAVPFTDLSGFLYFTDPNNIELIVKILDFQTQYKLFYSQLTNLRFTMVVTDTSTGRSKSYVNTEGECGAIDDNAFPKAITSGFEASDSPEEPVPVFEAATAGTCVADDDTLCLLNQRFAIEVTWRNQFNGQSGVGRPQVLSPLTGAFSFTDPANLEILVKVLDFQTKFLVLYGSLSNLEYTLRVVDTVTGRVRTYQNPPGRYCGGIDDNAFPPS